MSDDERTRALERELLARPDDAAGWLQLIRAHERSGRAGLAAAAALRGWQAVPGDALLRAALEASGLQDGPWPASDGDPSARRASPLDGPQQGVLRWRTLLPRLAIGRPLVDLAGRVLVRTEPAGLVRVSPDGAAVEDLGEWPADVAPALVGGEPRAVDLLRGRLVGPGRDDREWLSEARPLVRGRAGRLYQVLHAAVVAIDRTAAGDDDYRWRHDPDSPVSHVAEDAAQVVLALEPGPVPPALRSLFRRSSPVSPRIVALDRDAGRVLWSWRPGSPAHSSGPGDARADASGRHGQVAGRPAPARVALLDDGGVAVRLEDELVVLDRDVPRWQRKLAPASTLAASGDLLVVASLDGVLGLDAATGATRFARPDLPARGAPAIDGRGACYLTLADGRFVGVTQDGAVAVQLLLPGGPAGPPAIGYDATAYVSVGRELIAVR